jgi:hypothetical protein
LRNPLVPGLPGSQSVRRGLNDSLSYNSIADILKEGVEKIDSLAYIKTRPDGIAARS